MSLLDKEEVQKESGLCIAQAVDQFIREMGDCVGMQMDRSRTSNLIPIA